jgi:hypothetical protein
MIAEISGQVVETESAPYDFNGLSGVTHRYYLRDPEDKIGSAQRVKIKDQTQMPKIGDVVRARVDIFAQASDFGGAASLRVTHVEFLQTSARHAGPEAVKAS